ncbi:hypothetical protein KJ912_03710 [Patescibacteria group bacterium]|nr:hypothetical protein [Patescibacteria group bacterium]
MAREKTSKKKSNKEKVVKNGNGDRKMLELLEKNMLTTRGQIEKKDKNLAKQAQSIKRLRGEISACLEKIEKNVEVYEREIGVSAQTSGVESGEGEEELDLGGLDLALQKRLSDRRQELERLEAEEKTKDKPAGEKVKQGGDKKKKKRSGRVKEKQKAKGGWGQRIASGLRFGKKKIVKGFKEMVNHIDQENKDKK